MQALRFGRIRVPHHFKGIGVAASRMLESRGPRDLDGALTRNFSHPGYFDRQALKAVWYSAAIAFTYSR